MNCSLHHQWSLLKRRTDHCNRRRNIITSMDQENTELHFAVLLREQDTAEKLFWNEPKLAFQKNSMGKYPLLMACENGDSKMVKLLWPRHECSPSLPNDYHHGCLHAAVRSCIPEAVDAIFELEKRDNNKLEKLAFSADSAGDYPIHIAARRGNLAALKLFLEKLPRGERLLFMVDKQGRNALHIAQEHKHEKISCHLLENRRWLSLAFAPDRDGQTFIEKAQKMDENALGKFVKALSYIPKTEDTAHLILATKVSKMANKWQDRKRKQAISTSFSWLSVTAVLLATISYQGVLSVPGGVNNSGHPNLQSNKNFQWFVILNTVSLTLSVLVVICLTLDMMLGFMSLERYLFRFKLRMKYLNGLIGLGVVCILASFSQALRALLPNHNPISGFYEILALSALLFDFVVRVAFNFKRFREKIESLINMLQNNFNCKWLGFSETQPSLQPVTSSSQQLRSTSIPLLRSAKTASVVDDYEVSDDMHPKV